MKKSAQYIFEELHSSPIGAHCGIQKTLDAISKRFYWPGMSVDIKKWASLICESFVMFSYSTFIIPSKLILIIYFRSNNVLLVKKSNVL